MTDIEYIASKLSNEELLCQLAEEASELAQAALKLRRASTGSNPTITSYYDAVDNLLEELADVRVAEQAVIQAGTKAPVELGKIIANNMEEKTARWVQRLREKEDSHD